MLSQRLAIFALQNYKKVQAWIDEVCKGRALFEHWCMCRGMSFYPSHGNFVLFKVRQPNEVCSELTVGIYIRNRNQMLPGYVRATIGSEEHVIRLISALSQISHLL